MPVRTIGILGGGQLGRMLAIAAARLGLSCHIYCPESDAPAVETSKRHFCGAYDDEVALRSFAQSVDVATYEFENVPVSAAEIVAQLVPLRPGIKPLAKTQDRLTEKNFLRECKLPITNFAYARTKNDLAAAYEQIGAPAIGKSRHLGYDGKGQFRVEERAALNNLDYGDCILEELVLFEKEISVIGARSLEREEKFFDLAENQHKAGILRFSQVPANISPAVAQEARDITSKIMRALDYVGVIGVEFFVCQDEKSAKERLLVNEIAPRVHNSGHWTLDACACDQFTQHIRAICGWRLGETNRYANAIMENLLGEEATGLAERVTAADSALHLYGKKTALPGRKMGHMTKLTPIDKRDDK